MSDLETMTGQDLLDNLFDSLANDSGEEARKEILSRFIERDMLRTRVKELEDWGIDVIKDVVVYFESEGLGHHVKHIREKIDIFEKGGGE